MNTTRATTIASKVPGDEGEATVGLAALLEHIQAHIPGPWAVEACGEKGDGAYMIGIVYHPDDDKCANPLAGFLPDADEDGEFIEYYVDEPIAEVDFHHSGGAYAADLIWRAPDLARTVIEQADEIDHLRVSHADLLAALEAARADILDLAPMRDCAPAVEAIDVAIRKAKGA